MSAVTTLAEVDCEVFAVVYLRSLLFWDMMLCQMVIGSQSYQMKRDATSYASTMEPSPVA
jgi:hypothetical protein